MKRAIQISDFCCFAIIDARTLVTVIVLVTAICLPARGPGGRSHAAGVGDVWQTVPMRVTAYCPCQKCCGEYSDGITASGHKIRPGDTFAAADKQYPFGTKIIIPGYNNAEPVEVLDRGGAISGDRLDVFFNTHQEALQWGVKYLDVKVQRR